MKSMSRRSFVSVGATAIATVALFGCSSCSNASETSDTLPAGSPMRLATGSESGTYYAVGNAIADHADENAGLDITVVSSEGSKANVLSLEKGEAQLGLSQSDVMAYAYRGENLFENAKITCFSAVANLYEEQIQIVTCDPEIKSVADLMGKNVSVGAKGSGVYFNAIDVLSSYAITENDITPSYQDFQDSTDALKDGTIDAAFLMAGAPTPAITALAADKPVYLVEIDPEHTAMLIATSDYYALDVIPAGTYQDQQEGIDTLSVGAVLLAHDSCSEEDIYALVADLYENIDELESQNEKFSEFSIEKGASITTIPYHPGAAKFFEEQGLKVKSK